MLLLELPLQAASGVERPLEVYLAVRKQAEHAIATVVILEYGAPLAQNDRQHKAPQQAGQW